MTQSTPDPHGHEMLTAADAWFMLTGQAPTTDEEAMLDELLHKHYVEEFGEEPPKQWIFPDAPRTEA